MRRARLFAAPLLLLALALPAGAQPEEIPPGNDPSLESPPPRPGAEGAQERARVLFEAIVRNDPEHGMPMFMSRDVFRQIKGVADPDRFYDRMLSLFHRDVAEVHEQVMAHVGEGERPCFDRLELSRRRGWVVPRQESNRLPYWAQRHNWIYYKVGEEEHRFEVRTMIAWDGEWYITHLSEFRR